MEGQEIINAISSVGFPIVACGALFWMINNTIAELTTANTELTKAINNLTAYLRHDSEKDETS